MPKAKAGTGAVAKKPRAPKGHKLPEVFPSGEILKDNFKQEWKLGSVIGQGGFGLIYLASSSKQDSVKDGYVIKIEPHANGPLFCEMHFYQRVAQPAYIDSFKKTKKLKYMCVPKFIANGQHLRNGEQFRFLVLERFGTDLQKIFVNSGHRFQRHTVCGIALRMIDALECIHNKDYVHADIKAANILVGYKGGHENLDEIHLVDYGLAVKYVLGGNHVVYKEDPRKAHDGTIEFTSTDAHKGVAPTRRGDLEILGFCCLQWLCGRLPWEDKLADKNYVASSKFKYMKDLKSLMKDCFTSSTAPDEILKYFEAVKSLGYDEAPDYDGFRSIFRSALKKLSWKDEWKLDLLSVPLASSASQAKGTKRKSTGEACSTKPKQKAVEKLAKGKVASPSPKSKATKSKKEMVLSPKYIPTPPRKISTPKRKTTPKRELKSPVSQVKRTNTAVATPSPRRQGVKRSCVTSPQMNGTSSKSPAVKASTKRLIKRKRVQTTDASTQMSPR